MAFRPFHTDVGSLLESFFLAFQSSFSLLHLFCYLECTWPVCTRLCPHSCRCPIWPGEAV